MQNYDDMYERFEKAIDGLLGMPEDPFIDNAMDNQVAFIQFLRPNGRKCLVYTPVSPEVFKMSQEIRDRGWSFEIEILMNEMVSMEICNEDSVLACELCPNGPEVPIKVESMIRYGYDRLVNEQLRGNPRDEQQNEKD